MVRLRRPPNNYFDTALIDGRGDGLRGARRLGLVPGHRAGRGGQALLRRARLLRQRRPGHRRAVRAALRLFAAPLPVVAAVQGAAIGGGFGLALSADFRVATPESRFSANFARLGFHHGFALTVTLPAAVGRQAAADLLLTGRRVGGEEALALGLCDRLADRGRPAGPGTRLRRRSWRRRGRWPCAPSGPRCAAAWWSRPAGHGARVRRADAAARRRPTSPRACAPRRSGATPRFRGA